MNRNTATKRTQATTMMAIPRGISIKVTPGADGEGLVGIVDVVVLPVELLEGTSVTVDVTGSMTMINTGTVGIFLPESWIDMESIVRCMVWLMMT